MNGIPDIPYNKKIYSILMLEMNSTSIRSKSMGSSYNFIKNTSYSLSNELPK